MSRTPKVRIARPTGRPFQIRYTCPTTKKEIRLSVGSRDEAAAEQLKRETEAKLTLGLDPSPQKPASTATGYAEPWETFRERHSRDRLAPLRDGSAASTEVRLDVAERILKPRTVRDVASTESLERLKVKLLAGEGREQVELQKPRSPHTVKSYMAAVTAALNWRLGYVPRFEKVKTSKLKAMKSRPITLEEFERMLNAVVDVVGKGAAESWQFIMWGAWESGLRN